MSEDIKEKTVEEESADDVTIEEVTAEDVTAEEEVKEKVEQKAKSKKEKNKLSKSDKKIKELEDKNKESIDGLKRLAAEFDNFRKRTQKEKESIYISAANDVVENFLPVIDNMDIAKQSVQKSQSVEDVIEGFELIYRQFNETLEKIGVEEIDSMDQDFDPELHNAVMHVEDDKYEDNKVIEVLQKGYIYKGKVIRHSMVKVAN